MSKLDSGGNDKANARAFDGCWCMNRVGKKKAGRKLDGETLNALPWGGE